MQRHQTNLKLHVKSAVTYTVQYENSLNFDLMPKETTGANYMERPLVCSLNSPGQNGINKSARDQDPLYEILTFA